MVSAIAAGVKLKVKASVKPTAALLASNPSRTANRPPNPCLCNMGNSFIEIFRRVQSAEGSPNPVARKRLVEFYSGSKPTASPVRAATTNREWAEKMREIGLQPSDTARRQRKWTEH